MTPRRPRTTSKVFTLRREQHRGTGKCDPTVHNILVGSLYNRLIFCPDQFTCITGLTIPVGRWLRVKLVVVKGRKRECP